MRIRALISGLLTLAVVACLSTAMIAQEVTGTIVGTVKDANGAVVSGATVVITDTAKKVVVRTIMTNSDGDYSAPNLSPSEYSVSVEAPNFKKSVQTGVKLDVGQRRSVDINLQAGNVAETVTVEADRVAIDSTSATGGTIISGDQAREIPVNNRNWVQLITLAPGVSNDLADQVYVGTTNPDGQANTINISVNGARSSQNTFTVDGADVTDRGSNITIQAYPSLDSIGEFKVLRSLFPAESGRSGGGQINVVTRSGGSKFRGSAFLFWRNEQYNANNYLVNSTTGTPAFGRNCFPADGLPNSDERCQARRAPFSYYNYGGTFGGPVYFLDFGERGPGEPYFRKYDRTFFFFSTERRRDRRFTSPITTTVPDAFLKNGVFPVPVCINRTYLSETCTGSNILAAGTPIPAAMINPAALAYLNGVYRKLANPNNPSVSNPFALVDQIPNEADFRQELIKIDHSFNDQWSMYYRYQQDKIPTLDGNSLFSSGTGLNGVSTTSTNSPGKTHTFQTTYAASPTLIFEGRYNYGYGAILSQNVGLLALSNTQVPVTLPFANQRDRIPSISGNGFTGLGSFGPYDNFSYKHNFTGTTTWLSGNHAVKFGGVYSIYRKNENALAGVNEGSFTAFPATRPAGTTLPINYTTPGGVVLTNAITTTVADNLQRWASFLVGNVSSFSQASFDYTADLRQKTIEAFVQDEWKAKSNMTISVGLRYSYFGAPWDKNGRLSNFDPAMFSAASAPLVTGAGNRIVDPTRNFCSGIFVNEQNYATAANNCTPTLSPYGKYVIDVSKTDFAPRVGIAWDPFKKGKTSVRMGYGMYHEQVLNGTFLQNIGVNPPYQITATASTTSLNNPAANSAVASGVTSQSLRAVQADWKTPYMQHWTLDVQQQITSKTVVTIGYAGSKGTHLQGLTELNSLPAGKALASTCAPGNNYTGQAAAFTPVACQQAGYAFRNSATTAAQGNTNVVGTTAFNDNLILDQIRPYRGYRSIAIVQPRYDSNYHSLQMSATHRLGVGSQIGANYTWSKNLTTSINDRSTAPQNAYDIRSEYQLAAFDRRHILSVNYVYELPFFKKQQGFVGKMFGGWQFNGIATYNSGLPFTVTTSSYDAAGLGILNTNPSARPNITCDPNQGGAQTLQQWFNTSCFTTNPALVTGVFTPVPNTVGNTARGNVTGPSTVRFDLTAVKNLRFGETFRIQLRAEGFNIFNNVNFRGLNTNVSLASFGTVSTVRDSRTMQFGAKVFF
ncbi:MAG: carboxypeptidase regulatory-like domain-containing protein [Acidobacteria bacterium]|nr:carboxypeptidase regulatory-like domain-containing protein [Acidobacteriota bacterium]